MNETVRFCPLQFLFTNLMPRVIVFRISDTTIRIAIIVLLITINLLLKEFSSVLKLPSTEFFFKSLPEFFVKCPVFLYLDFTHVFLVFISIFSTISLPTYSPWYRKHCRTCPGRKVCVAAEVGWPVLRLQ